MLIKTNVQVMTAWHGVPGHTVWGGDQWSAGGGCPCSWRCRGANHDQDWHSHNQDPAPSSSETIVRPDDMIRTREWRRMSVSVFVTVSTHVELRLPRGGWKNEREIVARNKNMLRTKHQSWQNKHWALLVIFMLVAWKCDVFRLDKTKRYLVVKPSC